MFIPVHVSVVCENILLISKYFWYVIRIPWEITVGSFAVFEGDKLPMFKVIIR